MLVNIKDDFDLMKIAESGQCFRANREADGSFCFLAMDNKCIIRAVSESEYEVSVSEKQWKEFWEHYFDFGLDYAKVRKLADGHKDDFMIKSCEDGCGIRILNQNPWEMLISFIISQRKSIPAIKTCIEKLCRSFGKVCEGFYAFPEPEALVKADNEVLADCGLGYRLEYIKDAAAKVFYHELDLEQISELPDEELGAVLKSVKGVGDKVANCIMLFAYHRTASVPVDTWVKKIMEEDYGGENPFLKYGDAAGIMQQYAFYHKRQ
ncbi:MAG: DNA-3-methyladenine glycosylase 2 family protein [Lachnospiraceae bacterium]|nr:DNA-3-methyladenine glycosylase 2 family protein [Lachnospiraceae bacterium]